MVFITAANKSFTTSAEQNVFSKIVLKWWILPSRLLLNDLQQLGMGLINMFIYYGDLLERRKGIARLS